MAFDIDRVPSRILSFLPVKTRANARAAVGTSTMYRLTLQMNVTDAAHLKMVEKILPGTDSLTKDISGADSDGGKMVGAKRLGVVSVKIGNALDGVVVESKTAKAGAPTLAVKRRALETFLTVPIILHVPRDSVLAMHDNFLADTWTSMATAQADLLDKPKSTKKRGGNGVAAAQTDIESAGA